jgi:uncharacterized protein YlxP (DUF503 family)
MVVGISVFEIHVPASRGLKEKRKVIKSLIDRIHHRFRVSIAETDYHDLHQRAEISIAAIGQNHQDGERMMSSIRELIESEPAADLIYWDPQLLEGAP